MFKPSSVLAKCVATALAAACALWACGGGGGADAVAVAAPPATGSSTSSTSTPTTSVSSTSTSSVSGTTCSSTTVDAVQLVCLANAFKASLSASDQSLVQYPFSQASAVRWSNLPASMSARNGVKFGNLNAASLTAAQALLRAALGAQGEASRASFLLADDVLGSVQSNGYGSANYYLAFIGTPSVSTPWIVQFTGHHYTSHITVNGPALSATPMFIAIEPQTFSAGGRAYEPMAAHRTGVYDLLESLDSAQQSAAKLAGTYTDLVLTPGKDGQFPTAREGILASTLTAAQQTKLKTAVEAWVKNVDATLADSLLNDYMSAASLASTYIGWSGAINRVPAQNAYVRIDGPKLWIEFSAQRGIIYPTQIHFHSIWRDKTRDYGAQFSF